MTCLESAPRLRRPKSRKLITSRWFSFLLFLPSFCDIRLNFLLFLQLPLFMFSLRRIPWHSDSITSSVSTHALYTFQINLERFDIHASFVIYEQSFAAGSIRYCWHTDPRVSNLTPCALISRIIFPLWFLLYLLPLWP